MPRRNAPQAAPGGFGGFGKFGGQPVPNRNKQQTLQYTVQQEIVMYLVELGGVRFLQTVLKNPYKLVVTYEDLKKALNPQQLKDFDQLAENCTLQSLAYCSAQTAFQKVVKLDEEQIIDQLDDGIKQQQVVLALNKINVSQLKLKQQNFQVLSGNFSEVTK